MHRAWPCGCGARVGSAEGRRRHVLGTRIHEKPFPNLGKAHGPSVTDCGRRIQHGTQRDLNSEGFC